MSEQAQRTLENRQEQGEQDKPHLLSRPTTIIIVSALAALLFIYLAGVLADSYSHENTDNAFLDGRIIAMAPKVSGRVAAVEVTDNQQVKTGALLVQLDPRDFQVALDQHRAAVDAATANEHLLEANLKVAEAQENSASALARQSAADVTASEAGEARARADFERAQSLSENRTISQQEFDAAKAASQAAEANLHAAREKAASDQAKVAEAQAQAQASRRALQRAAALTAQARMDVKAAELNLSYATLRAPEDGQVTRKAVEAGDYVQAGQRLMALVPNDLWVTANFKETQLKNIRIGQIVSVEIDSVKGRRFRAHVDSIQAGSGARFSMLPPENAVGNFVKVVQRVPVKIVFDEQVKAPTTLGPGMSVSPAVRVKSFTLSYVARVVIGIVLAAVLAFLWFMGTRSARQSGGGD